MILFHIKLKFEKFDRLIRFDKNNFIRKYISKRKTSHKKQISQIRYSAKEQNHPYFVLEFRSCVYPPFIIDKSILPKIVYRFLINLANIKKKQPLYKSGCPNIKLLLFLHHQRELQILVLKSSLSQEEDQLTFLRHLYSQE